MSHPQPRRLLAEVLLVAVAAVWGWTFVMVKDAVALYPTLPFLALRFGLATAVVGLVMVGGVVVRRARRRPVAAVPQPASGEGPPVADGSHTRRGPSVSLRGLLAGGTVMGLFLGAGYIFQTFGLERTSASNAGFITGLFVVLVPPMQALVWRVWPGRDAIAGALLAAVGLFLLSGGPSLFDGTSQAGRLSGDALVFACAVSFAAHILATGHYAGRADPSALTLVQLATVAVMTGLLTVVSVGGDLMDPPGLPTDPQVWFALVITAVFASAAAFYIQTYAQRHTQPARTAVILTMEPVFAGLFGFLLAGERLTPSGWLGAALIMVGMLTAELELFGGRSTAAD